MIKFILTILVVFGLTPNAMAVEDTVPTDATPTDTAPTDAVTTDAETTTDD